MGIWFNRTGAPPAQARSFIPPWLLQSDDGSPANIDGSRIEMASQSIAIRSAVDLLASLASELPVDIFRGKGPDRKQMQTPGYFEDPAGDGHGREDWTYQVMYSWLYRGNLYAQWLDRAPQNYLTQIELFHPDRVSGVIESGAPVWSVNGKEIKKGQFIHRRVNPVPGQVKGVSPISLHATSIATNIAATRFGKGWFDADAQPIGILRNTQGSVDEDQGKSVKRKFMAALRGRQEPVTMGKGWEWQQIQVTPEESQFLGTMGYSSADCCRIFGPGIAQILGYETGGAMTYANIQDHDIQLLKYSLNRWLRRMERFYGLMLPSRQYAVFNRDAILETNTMQRYLAHASALDKGWKVVNEVRRLENMVDVDWGDEPNPKQWPLSTTPAPVVGTTG
ncbi:MAG TPA: phage portal protein [Jiangellaceae bacterium]|nr:phage portal protein [Jiangellaceae bacterium]